MSLTLFAPSARSHQTVPALFIDVKELSRLLTRSVESLLRDVRAARIPKPIRIGRAVRWRRAEIEDWIAAGCPALAR